MDCRPLLGLIAFLPPKKSLIDWLMVPRSDAKSLSALLVMVWSSELALTVRDVKECPREGGISVMPRLYAVPFVTQKVEKPQYFKQGIKLLSFPSYNLLVKFYRAWRF